MKKFLNFILFKFLFVFLLSSIFYLLSSASVFAADFKTDYQVEYNLSQSQDNLSSQVDFRIKITNLRSDVYVNKFAISFPNTFSINNLKASDDHGAITPKTIVEETKTKVELEFSDPTIGKDSVNTFFLNFNQANLFKVNGKIWEVVLPVIENTQDESYQVTVNLPEATSKKISIAKPKPDSVSGNKIFWNNPKTKTIYAVFGDNQVYQTELTYHLKNDQIYPVFTEIAFPPDTVFQKTFIQLISPVPESVYQDEDGNYLGKYFLKPLENKTITYKSFIQIYTKSRDEVVPVVRKAINQQKNYLLTEKKYWQINQIDKIKNITQPKGIYDFVTNTLQYNYKKLNSQNKRLGADAVLTYTDQAVCMEFTDLFVAIAREKGIYSREIQGYGFSLDPRLQPLSLSSDILHAWPEYYDLKAENWIAVDPTWGNTSGIDYFSSFDLNHIAFVIHGKNPDYPMPAGMYKTENSRDVSIKPVITDPVEKKEIIIEGINFPTTISDEKIYQGKFIIKNNGNSYLWQIPVEIKAKNITIAKEKFIIPVLAPLEKKSIIFDYSSQEKNKRVQGILIINVLQKQLLEQPINVIPFVYTLIIKAFIVLLGLSALILIYRLLTKIKRHDH
ncbi:MAG: transglutaminase domain-containing protein [Candidatus Roizmanbacteria bacterium]|nr:transglutaminase domain-containing protein [Candidatus Roizmanbacteria bacterium]